MLCGITYLLLMVCFCDACDSLWMDRFVDQGSYGVDEDESETENDRRGPGEGQERGCGIS